jgi:hypothetical protein
MIAPRSYTAHMDCGTENFPPEKIIIKNKTKIKYKIISEYYPKESPP